MGSLSPAKPRGLRTAQGALQPPLALILAARREPQRLRGMLALMGTQTWASCASLMSASACSRVHSGMSRARRSNSSAAGCGDVP